MSVFRGVPTRRGFILSSAAALAAGALLPRDLALAAQLDRDRLDLLYAQEQALIDHYTATLAAFDDQRFRDAGLPDGIRSDLETVLAAEKAHQAVVTRPDRPRVDGFEPVVPDDPLAALRQAAELENLAVATYAFVIPDLGRERLVPDLLGILSVEARHAAWLATLLGDDPFPVAIDAPLSLEQPEPVTNGAAATPVSGDDSTTNTDMTPFIAAIADEVDVSPDEITVLAATPEVWPDASLGCPQPDMLYAQVLTPGFLVLVEVAGEQIEFHTDERGAVVLCP